MFIPSNENEKLLIAIVMALFDSISSFLLSIFYFLKNFKNLISKRYFYKEIVEIFREKEFLAAYLSYQVSSLLGNFTSIVAASNLTSNLGRIKIYYAHKLSTYIHMPVNYLYLALGRKDINFKKNKEIICNFFSFICDISNNIFPVLFSRYFYFFFWK